MCLHAPAGFCDAICIASSWSGGVDQVKAGELFLRFRERAIGDRNAPVADAKVFAVSTREERLGGEQQALFRRAIAAVEAFAIGHRVKLSPSR